MNAAIFVLYIIVGSAPPFILERHGHFASAAACWQALRDMGADGQCVEIPRPRARPAGLGQ